MVLRGRPIKRLRTGLYQIKLTDHERTLIRELPGELIKQIEAVDDDGSMFRLFPPGYTHDLGLQVEYDRLMRDDLQKRHIEALRILEETAGAKEIDESQMNAWIKAINQLRLVLGTRLEVQENMTEDDIDPEDPQAGAFALYEYLGYLQVQAVEAMSEDL